MKRNHNHLLQRLLAGTLAAVLSAGLSLTALAAAEPSSESASKLPVPTRVSVHDPSIIRTEDGTYYVLGSHTASAQSDDLIQWKQINYDYGSVSNTPFYGNLKEVLEKPFAWAGYDDGDCSGGHYAVWAPDIIWNPGYQWEDGSLGAYMLYCCTSSTWRRSCISYLVSQTFDGDYQYVDTIVYSGFTENGSTDGNSKRNTCWDNDYLNLNSLLEKGSAGGGIDEISSKWFDQNGNWNHAYAPNAIDPNIFFDADGERLYMSYGSWSGGLFLLELDPATGEAIYPGTDYIDEVSGNFVDRYFGVHLAGGNHQSGEGPYIRYDAETGYYYLYETYGGLTAEGGYNMRLFRSENPTGPYLDAAGGSASDNGQNNDKYGIKLIGNYQFYDQTGMRAAGHNSVLIDEDGSRYLVCHQRFDSSPQTEGHEVRVRQQFLNEDLWPVPAVYEYRGEQPEHYEDAEVIGSYEFIDHGTRTDGSMLSTQTLTLCEDGSVSGAYDGVWFKTDSGRGYDYITITTEDETTYKGLFFRQHKENGEPDPVMTFSAIGSNNTCIWGSMIDMENSEMVADMAAVSIKQQLPSSTKENLPLTSSIMGANVTWSSSEPSVISDTGIVTPQAEDVKAVLTADIVCGDYSRTETFRVTVKKAASLIYGFDFETASEDGSVAPSADSSKTDCAQLIGGASVITDEARGAVLQISNEPGAIESNYLQLPQDTLSDVRSTGFSVAMWVNIGADTFEHSALFEADAGAAYPMTRIGANLIARINANSFSDVQDSLLTTNGERNTWQHVAYTVDALGIRVYLNGTLVGEEKKSLSNCFIKNASGISRAVDVRVGSGPIWGDEDCRLALFDDIRIYDGILGTTEVQQLYLAE